MTIQSACPCGSGEPYAACCLRFLEQRAEPKTAEELMRSRYSAFAKGHITYLKDTLWPRHQAGFDAGATAKWAEDNHWTGLTVLATEAGRAGDRDGTVLFEARYLAEGRLQVHRELSRFRKKAGRWYYVEALPE